VGLAETELDLVDSLGVSGTVFFTDPLFVWREAGMDACGRPRRDPRRLTATLPPTYPPPPTAGWGAAWHAARRIRLVRQRRCAAALGGELLLAARRVELEDACVFLRVCVVWVGGWVGAWQSSHGSPACEYRDWGAGHVCNPIFNLSLLPKVSVDGSATFLPLPLAEHRRAAGHSGGGLAVVGSGRGRCLFRG
jgi:hypothetical protein